MMNLFTESPDKSEYARKEYLDGILNLIEGGFSNLPFKTALTPLEEGFGAPLDREIAPSDFISQEFVGEDEICEIYRLRFLPLQNTPFFALLFVPRKMAPPSPLVVAANGLLGTPELMYGMHGTNGYSNLTARLLKKGVCVLSPQFLLWNCGMSPAKPCYKTKYNRAEIDSRLKEKGGSINSLEIFFLLSALSALSKLKFLDTSKIAACGMSYGAFLTMRTMAVSPLIKAGYFMSCANGSLEPDFPEWFFRAPYASLSDCEFLAYCAPRPVFVEVGKFDDIFPVDGAISEMSKAKKYYAQKGAEENFRFNIWNGGHIVNREDTGIDYIISSLK